MAIDITISIPTTVAPRVSAAFVANFNYTGPNTTQAKIDFVQAKLQQYIKNQVKFYEVGTASTNAGNTASAQVDADLPTW